MERLGLDEASLRERNPDLICATVSAFGSDGPYAERVGIDVVFQAESGMMSLTGEPGSPPGKTATTIGDYLAATNTALAICASLFARSTQGRGRSIDVSLRDSLIAVQAGWNAIAFEADAQPDKTGTASPFLSPNRMFATSDGYFVIAIVSDRHFALMCQVIDRADLEINFHSNDDRIARRHELESVLEPLFAEQPTMHWIDAFTKVGVPCGRVLTLPEVWEDVQVKHNQMVVDYVHPVAGPVRGLGSPIRIDGAPARTRIVPPTLGG